MPYDSNGNYTLPPIYKAVPGTEIATQQHNSPLEDVQAALNQALLRNSSAPIQNNWNMGSNRITFLADGVADTDAANVGQVNKSASDIKKDADETYAKIADPLVRSRVGDPDYQAFDVGVNKSTGRLWATYTDKDGKGQFATAALASELDAVATAKQDKLGFTPVRQGGGAGQYTNVIYIGWANDGSNTLRCQVDVTDLGPIALVDKDCPVGSMILWPLVNPPAGWLVMNGSGFDTNMYKRLASIFPNGLLPDWRGLFPRGYDPISRFDIDGGGRGIMTYQEGSVLFGEGGGNVANVDSLTPAKKQTIGWENNINPSFGAQGCTKAGDSQINMTGNYIGISRPKNMNCQFIVRAL